MPYAAITYRVKPGYEEEIAEIFGNFKRVGSPLLYDENGNESGKLLGTAVFIQEDVVVRVIHYEGKLEDVGRKMGGQGGVHELEGKLAQYLQTTRDTGTADGFQNYFRDATMRCISQLSLDTLPKAG